jgi:chemotaxis protein methyltransferase CheR
MVTFTFLNLAEDTYPALLNNTNAMDIILCRNVLMYFAPERAKKVLHNLYRALGDGGWLIVSPSEALHALCSPFETVNFPGVILYRKPRRETATRNMEAWEINRAASSSPEVADAPFSAAAGQPQREASQVTPDQKADTLFEEGCSEEAVEQLGARLSQNPADAQALALMARVHANQGQLAVALGWCEKAVAVDRLNPAYHYLLATILQELGQAEAAMHALKRTLYLDQNFVLAHVALGTLTQQQERSKESHKHFANALALLSDYRQDEILPESEGITAGRLREIIRSMGD